MKIKSKLRYICAISMFALSGFSALSYADGQAQYERTKCSWGGAFSICVVERYQFAGFDQNGNAQYGWVVVHRYVDFSGTTPPPDTIE
jgi:hypothetical protein